MENDFTGVSVGASGSNGGDRAGGGPPNQDPKPREECLVDTCTLPRKRNNRFCPHHSRLYDNMRYQANRAGKEQLHKFIAAMRDAGTASKQLKEFAEENVGSAMFKTKQLINWVGRSKQKRLGLRKRHYMP